MNRLVGGGEQVVEAQFVRSVAEASCQRTTEELRAGVVDQLQEVFAIKGKERRVHDLENARQKRRCLKRADALLLQQIGKRVDLTSQFAQCIGGACAAGAE